MRDGQGNASSGKQGGFSLLEAVAVLGLVVLVAAISFMSLPSLSAGGEAGQAAREMLLSMRSARWMSVVSGRRVRIRPSTAGEEGCGGYEIEKEEGGRWAPLGEGGRLPPGVTLTATGPAVKVFYPNGTSSFGSLIVAGPQRHRYRISLNPATGRVRLWKGAKEVGVEE